MRYRLAATFALLTATVAVIVALGGCARGGVPQEVQAALRDAAALAGELAERYESYKQDASSASDASQAEDLIQTEQVETEATTHADDASFADIEDAMARVAASENALAAGGDTWGGSEQALAALDNLRQCLQYEHDILEAQRSSSDVEETGLEGALTILVNLSENYQKIDPPAFLAPYLSNTIDTLPTIVSALVYSAQSSSTLASRSSNELLTWWFTKQSAYDDEASEILVQQCRASENMLTGLADASAPTGAPAIAIDAIDTIAPNLYPSLDAAVNLGVTSYDDAHSLLVSVEVAGFTQAFEQRYDLPQGYSYLPIKPSLLPDLDLSRLNGNSSTQLNVKVSDPTSGEVLAQESHPVNLLSIYDFTWSNDEFGSTATFDILAWLRPQADEVAAINRAAADVLGSWTNGAATTLAGYQYGDDVVATLMQAAAIQKAISDAGVVYIYDPYSFTSDQHVLTPEAVVQKRSGLCIETSLLMASCLLSANMHPLIVITPGHAQIALETYQGSGNYFLLETTTLPYEGADTSLSSSQGAYYNGFLASAQADDGSTVYWTTSGTSQEWENYFQHVGDSRREYDGIFVIDCALQPIMGIQGIENASATPPSALDSFLNS